MQAKPTFQPLGELEQAVMDVVWAHSPATAREVCDRMHGRRERAYTTIMTTMDRLHRKGLLRREKDGLAWRYEPALNKTEFEKAVADGMAAGISEPMARPRSLPSWTLPLASMSRCWTGSGNSSNVAVRTESDFRSRLHPGVRGHRSLDRHRRIGAGGWRARHHAAPA